MTYGQMLIYDLPDDYPSLRTWLDGIESEEFLANILAVQKLGPAFAGCTLLPESLWHLAVPIGFGRNANLIFFSLKTGDFLAVHGFTSRRSEDVEAGIEIARRRRNDLIGSST